MRIINFERKHTNLERRNDKRPKINLRSLIRILGKRNAGSPERKNIFIQSI